MAAGDSEYGFVVGNDVERDGMHLEVIDANGAVMAEVFYPDVTGDTIVTLDRPSLPLEAVERLLSVAKLRLPPRR